MRINPHDRFEALIQAPGEQILELGKEIETLRKNLASSDRVTASRRAEIIRQLDYFAARTREIEPVVEKLHEVADLHEMERSVEDDEPSEKTDFIARQSPPFAAVLLHRLATARAADDLAAAGDMRDVIATYARSSPLRGVRDLLVDGLRKDAFAHGETRPGYSIASVENVRRQALSCVPT